MEPALLPLKKVKPLPIYTPTIWQTVILRNYGLVSNERIALTLACNVKVVEKEAKRLGLSTLKYNPLYRDKSYLTIIRANWEILPYNQLMTLLDMDESALSYEFENHDFFGQKLGYYKPDVPEVLYAPLTKEQCKETTKIRNIIQKEIVPEHAAPFSFEYANLNAKGDGIEKIIYPYALEYGDVLLKTSELVSDKELEAYKEAGITGLWIAPLLSDISPYPFSKFSNDDYKIRRANLSKFIAKAASFGINVYIYLNEPRCIKATDLKEKYAYLKGREEGGLVSLCFSHNEVKQYLYFAVKDLLVEVPDIGGFITITASESLTHCKHRPGSDCEKCADIPPYILAAGINNTIQKAVDDSGTDAKVIADLWGWMPYCDITFDDAKKGIDLLDEKIDIMCVSEFGTHKNCYIGEYSISHGVPSLDTVKFFKYARKSHKIWAKIQVNNSWEISTLPFVPCFDLIIDHISELKKLGVNSLVLSWTVGGYPGINLSLANSLLGADFDYDRWLFENFGESAPAIKKASNLLSRGFQHLPFNSFLIYMSPLNIGPANLLYLEKTKRRATMVTNPYDDIEYWFHEVDRDYFLKEMKTLLGKWKKAVSILDGIASPNENAKQVIRYGKAWHAIYSSCFNQCEFIIARDKGEDLSKYLRTERILTRNLYKLAASDSMIGFEAANQYAFTPNIFLEKFLNLHALEKDVNIKHGENHD